MPSSMTTLEELLGESAGVAGVREQISRLHQRQADASRFPPVLLQGETGTGKGLVARLIHRAGPRAAGPFVDVNCAALPETLLEAELFGFERGAFTDARQAKPGLFQAAHRGTIFLDEIGLLPQGLQAKLLTVVEERAVRRLGSTRSEAVDVWIIAATNQDLLVSIRTGRFREDLYHRLAVVTLELPPLRERGQDILLLADYFLARACADYALPPKNFTPDARDALLAYPWPGNIRELSNVIERVALLSGAQSVTAQTLDLPTPPPADLRRDAGTPPELPLELAVGNVEREHLLAALRQTDWNISRAAARLGISRNTLRYRIEKHGLHRDALPPVSRRRAPTPSALAQEAAQDAAPPLASLRWEPRRLTLLRATLVGPPEDDVLPETSRMIEAMVEKVQSFGGRVEELSPKGVVAVFGLESLEDAPRRAALAAMAVQKAGERLREEGAERFAVKVGIHTDQLLVGRGPAAAQIDLDAKRRVWPELEELTTAAEPGTTLVSALAAPFLERRFDLETVGVSGSAAAPVYRLAGHEGTGFRLGERATRFVGRHHELELLHSRLASAMRGHGQVVGIVGEAGIGKSRLLFEFRQGLAGATVTYREGRCASYGSAIPYFPVIEMLRAYCRLTEADPPEVIGEKVRWSLERLGMEADESAPYLLQLLGVKEGTERLAVLSPEAINARTFEILRDMSLEGSRERPLVIAVEDVHWIDKASEAYGALLVESLATAPILFLLTYRPGYRPPWMEKSYATQVALQPLAPEESLSVMRSVIPAEAVSESLARVIVEKAEGNPFFLEELARAVREQGAHARPLSGVPDTIQDVLLARIDRLPGEPKRLLQAASVLGREFSLRLLGAIWDEPGSLEQHLRELTRQEFLYVQSQAEEPVYAFKHALTQEASYESLPVLRRQALHAAAGHALEARYAGRLEEAYDRLAYHFSRTDKAETAVQYLIRFAEKAVRNNAHVEAVRALREALPHVERLPEADRSHSLLDIVLRQARSLWQLGRFKEILGLMLEQEADLERLQDPSLAGPYYFLLSRTYTSLGDRERATRSACRALDEARRSGDEATMGKAHSALAIEESLSGHPLEAVESGQQAVAFLSRTEEQWWLGMANWTVGMNYALMGEFESALEAQERVHAIGKAIGDRRLQSSAAWTSGAIRTMKGEWEAGIEACQRGLDCSPDPLNTAIALGWLGYAYLEKGVPTEAIPLLEQSVRQLGQFSEQQFHGWFMTVLGEAHLLDGEVDRAHELATRGLKITRDASYWYGIGLAHRTLGRIARTRGLFLEAEQHFGEALKTFTSIRARYFAGRTHLDLAELAQAQGSRAAAAASFLEAHRLFRAIRLPAYAERVEQLAKAGGAELGGA